MAGWDKIIQLTKNRKGVGFWAETPEGKNWPVARPLPLDSDTELFLERLAVVESKAERVGYRGYSWCRVCKKHNCSREFYFGDYCWPEGYSHYIKEHNVAVEPDFFHFILNHDI